MSSVRLPEVSKLLSAAEAGEPGKVSNDYVIITTVTGILSVALYLT